MQGIWSRSNRARERSDEAYRLAPVDETLIHFAHITRHELHVELISYVDGGRLLDRLSDDEHECLLERARRSRLERAVRIGIDVTMALKQGIDLPHSTFHRLMPSVAELIEFQPVARPLQLLRKVSLLQGPKELAGLATVNALKRLSQLWSKLS